MEAAKQRQQQQQSVLQSLWPQNNKKQKTDRQQSAKDAFNKKEPPTNKGDSSLLFSSGGGQSDPLNSSTAKAKEKVMSRTMKMVPTSPPPSPQMQRNEFEIDVDALDLANLRVVEEKNSAKEKVELAATAGQGNIDIESACSIVDNTDVGGIDGLQKVVLIPKAVKDATYHRDFERIREENFSPSPVASGEKGAKILRTTFVTWPNAYANEVSNYIDSLFRGTKPIFEVYEYGRASLYEFKLDSRGRILGTGSLVRNVTAEVLTEVENKILTGKAVISSHVPLCLQQLVPEGGSLQRNYSNCTPFAGSTARGLEASCRVFFEMIKGTGDKNADTLFHVTSNLFVDVKNVRIHASVPSKNSLSAETHYSWKGKGEGGEMFGNLDASQMFVCLIKIFTILERITKEVRAVEQSFTFTIDTAKGSSALYDAVVNNGDVSVERFMAVLPMHGTGAHATCVAQERCMPLFVARLVAMCKYFAPRQSIVADGDEIRSMINPGRDKTIINVGRTTVKAGTEKQNASNLVQSKISKAMMMQSRSSSLIPDSIISSLTEKQNASKAAPVVIPPVAPVAIPPAAPVAIPPTDPVPPPLLSIPDKFVIVHDEKDYKHKCKECGKRYLSSGHLNDHRWIHIPKEDWPFPCPHCEARFQTNPKLNSHIQEVHDEERPFACTRCDKSFKRNSALTKHIRETHLNERPHECTFVDADGNRCQRRFTQKSALTTHMITHVPDSEKKKFKCEHCGASFPYKHGLKNHLAPKNPCTTQK